MKTETINIIKSSGEKATFSIEKLRRSLEHSGADQKTINETIGKVSSELYPGMSTKQIYNRAFALLKKKKNHWASKYKLKKAIYELGPTGFPFERFIGALLKHSGYKTEVGITIPGKCVSHEIDVIAEKNNKSILVECKFHNEKGINCNVKVPLYINSRYNDVKANWHANQENRSQLSKAWVVTNTRFTQDAINYGECANLYLLSWDYPKNNSLKHRIDHLGLYPITVSTILNKREKQFLLNRDIVLCRALIGDTFYLDHLGISENRKNKIMTEIKMLCTK